MKNARKGNGIIDNLIVKVGGVALYMGMALERVDYYVDNLLYMVHERQLDAMCRDVDYRVIINRILYQVSITLSFYVFHLYFLYFSHITLFTLFSYRAPS